MRPRSTRTGDGVTSDCYFRSYIHVGTKLEMNCQDPNGNDKYTPLLHSRIVLVPRVTNKQMWSIILSLYFYYFYYYFLPRKPFFASRVNCSSSSPVKCLADEDGEARGDPDLSPLLASCNATKYNSRQ